MLVELWNMKMEATKPMSKYTTSIVSIEGKDGVDYGDN